MNELQIFKNENKLYSFGKTKPKSLKESGARNGK